VKKKSSIYVAGGKTLIGAAILCALRQKGYTNVVGGGDEEPNLTDGTAVKVFLKQFRPEYVFLAAGRSGGIAANQKYPADLMIDNLLAECHVVHNAFRHGVKKLLFLASSCCYPRQCPQPMKEEALLTGPLESTNEAYAVAKIAGIKLCQAYCRQYGVEFIPAIPANVFGPGDDFSPDDSHVVAALIRRMHEAKVRGATSVEIWGTGYARREFVFAEDVADASIFVMSYYSGSDPVNLGCGSVVSIAELAGLIKEIVGFQGKISYDTSKPDGMPVKILDSSKLTAWGWRPRVPLRTALEKTYEWFLLSKGGDDHHG
jgi:GDP-L-fucose synthase